MKATNEAAVRRQDWRTAPNLVTLGRFALIGPIVTLLLTGGRPVVVAVLAILFGATDWLDGLLARKLGQESRVGEIIDPLADRLGIVCIGLALAVSGAAPWWVVLVILVVDAAVGSVALARHRSRRLAVTGLGKARTAVIVVSVIAVLLGGAPGAGWLMVAGQTGLVLGAVLHAAAGAGYLRQMFR